MRRFVFPAALALLALASTGSADWRDWIPKIPSRGGSSGTDVASGLKEALGQGVGSAVSRLGVARGFLDHPEVRIPPPGFLKPVAGALRVMGRGDDVDRFVSAMNEAASAAVPEAAKLLREAIAQMTIRDATEILRGPDDAATRYFRKTSETKLEALMLPVVERETSRVGVVERWKGLVASAGPAASLVSEDAADIDRYVTGKALDGLFFVIAEEERRIRENPAARTTELLRRTFGG